MMSDGPTLYRPVPRRPFAFGIKSPTPPQDEEEETQEQEQERLLANIRHQLLNSGFLEPQFVSSAKSPRQYSHSPPLSAASISRDPSILNINSSTLAGIYKSSGGSRERVFHDDDRSELHTPWGTGAETPVRRRESISEATYELMCDRSHPPHRRLSYPCAEATPVKVQTSPLNTAISLVSRATFLYLLGMGYGLLATHFHDEHSAEGNTVLKPKPSSAYLVIWGLIGVALGALLPWFDRLWEDYFGPEAYEAEGVSAAVKVAETGTDWALVMRAIGVFVGIVFAMRKLDWTSTMQLSVTLALADILLWWLIDRSIPGFVLSAGVALAGSLFLLGVDPQMMPAPIIAFGRHDTSTEPLPLVILGVSQKTIETGVWMLSVLFSSSLLFGNIGRRLTWEKSAVTRGRWGGLR